MNNTISNINETKNINSPIDFNGNTQLIFEAAKGNIKNVSILLIQGADPNMKNKGDETALMVVMYSDMQPQNMLQIIKLLLEYGADINAMDVAGHTALTNAIEQKEELLRWVDINVSENVAANRSASIDVYTKVIELLISMR